MNLPEVEVSSTNVRLQIETKVESEHSFSHNNQEHVFQLLQRLDQSQKHHYTK